jgi:hypothetical protein
LLNQLIDDRILFCRLLAFLLLAETALIQRVFHFGEVEVVHRPIFAMKVCGGLAGWLGLGS